MAAGPGLYQFLFEDIQPTVESFANDSSATMISVIGPLGASLLSAYVLMWAAGVATGQISEPITDFIKRVIRIAVIVGLALTAGVYQGMVVETFQRAPMELAGHLVIGGETPVDSANGMASLLDGVMEKGFDVGLKPWEEGKKLNAENLLTGVSAEGLLLQACAILLMIVTIVVTAIAATMMFVAYIAMALLLAIGPLFIVFAIFPSTQRWAEAWLGQVVNYAMLFVLLAVGCALLFAIIDRYFSTLVGLAPEPGQILWIALKATGLSMACCGVLWQLNHIAAGLAGGTALQATNVAGRMMGAGLSVAAGGAAGAHAARNLAGNARALYRGARGREITNRYPRTSRDLAHTTGQGLTRARKVFQGGNSIEGR